MFKFFEYLHKEGYFDLDILWITISVLFFYMASGGVKSFHAFFMAGYLK